MRRPSTKGRAIDEDRIQSWVDAYGSYKSGVGPQDVQTWLDQFDRDDRDLAARLLDVVEYFNTSRMEEAFRSALEQLDGWDRDPSKRRGRWFFLPFADSGGTSGDSMLYHFRNANSLNAGKWSRLFPNLAKVFVDPPSHKDTVVFVDDFSGTGDQACGQWTDTMKELLPLKPRVFLLLVASSSAAISRIRRETEMTPIVRKRLTNADRFFNEGCVRFTQAEKSRILKYCKKASPRDPRGYGDCGFVVVFMHKTPNNSIPVLHASRHDWKGLFPRR